ncbi:MAG: hypothetical protein KGR26_10845 [Cyanobacteria bacterium REEB65]|nr:hypothetical protein [Cyanobacteria bacterium REEB65]
MPDEATIELTETQVEFIRLVTDAAANFAVVTGSRPVVGRVHPTLWVALGQPTEIDGIVICGDPDVAAGDLAFDGP